MAEPEGASPGRSARETTANVRLRIASAAVLASLAVGGILAGGYVFAGLVAVLAALMSLEWSRQVAPRLSLLLTALYSVSILLAIQTCLEGDSRRAVVMLVLGAVFAEFASTGWRMTGRHRFLAALGVLYIGFAGLSAVDLRSVEGGTAIVLWLFAVTWACDTGAYLIGKPFGRTLLIKSISPSKTWEGLAGGVAASMAVGLAFQPYLSASPAEVLAASALLALIAQGGDLLESALKRHFGVKDMSRLVPGHGGVLDRLDSLLAVLVFAGAANALGFGR